MMRVVIIEDESLARDILRDYLQQYDDLELVGECENGFEGLKAIQELKPDVIFLDVQMPKINGFEMLELLDNPPHVIFSTAFDQYAIKAFENNAVDYLLKPYSPERFEEAVNRVRTRMLNQEEPEDLVKVSTEAIPNEFLSRIVVRTGVKIDVIGTDSIDYLLATGDYVEIHSDKGKFLKQITMKVLEERLDPQHYVRIHRSYLIAISRLSKIEHFEKESHLAIMKNGEKLPISRAGYGRLREILQF